MIVCLKRDQKVIKKLNVSHSSPVSRPHMTPASRSVSSRLPPAPILLGSRPDVSEEKQAELPVMCCRINIQPSSFHLRRFNLTHYITTILLSWPYELDG